MLEKIIMRLEQLEARLSRYKAKRNHERALRAAKMEINRLARMRAF